MSRRSIPSDILIESEYETRVRVWSGHARTSPYWICVQ
jgi:hypothetical protein